jgi:hypothetical protein
MAVRMLLIAPRMAASWVAMLDDEKLFVTEEFLEQ